MADVVVKAYPIQNLCWWCSMPRTQITQFVCIAPGRSKLGTFPPRETPTHRPVLDFKQQHTCSNRHSFTYTIIFMDKHWVNLNIWKIIIADCIRDAKKLRTTPGHSKMGVPIHTYTNRNWLTYIFTSSYRAAFLDTDERLILKHQIWLILSTANTYNNNIKWNDLTLHLWCSKSRTQMTQFVRILPGRSKLGIHPPGRRRPTGRSLILCNTH